RDYMNAVATQVRRERRIADMFGRMEYIPGIMSVFQQSQEAAVRLAVNQTIQGGAQGIIKEAMRKLWLSLSDWVYHGICYPIIQIHDDLMFEMLVGVEDDLIPEIRAVMEGAVKLSIPTPVDCKVGGRWSEMHEWKEVMR
ncbi:DNA polymerase, partial [Candidatus Magnetobacterium casense]